MCVGVRMCVDSAAWDGDKYTDTIMPLEFRPEDCEQVWCHNSSLLARLAHGPDR